VKQRNFQAWILAVGRKRHQGTGVNMIEISRTPEGVGVKMIEIS
jgi:hypothetical protein